MKNILKSGFILIFALGLVFSVTAGGQGEKEEERAVGAEEIKEPNLIRIRSVDWLTKKAFIGEAAEKFMAEHPEVKIEFEAFARDDVGKLIVQWSGGKSDVDLIVAENPETTTAFIMKDMLYSFDELGLWERFPKDRLVKAILDIGTIRGKVYYLPIMGEIYWINTNKKMLQDAGVADKDGNVPIPKNWEELLDMAAKSTVGEQAGMSIRFNVKSMSNSFYSCLKGLRKEVFESDGTTLVVDTPESRELLKAWKKGVDNKWITTFTMTDQNAGRTAYKAGKMALLLESGSRWPEAAPFIGSDNTGPLPYPGGLEGGSMLFIAGCVIPKQSAAPKTACKFLEEIYLTDLFQSKMLNVYGKMPSLKSAYAFASSPDWQQMLKATEISVNFPQYREFSKFEYAFGDNIQAYLLGKQDLDKTLEKIKNNLDTIDKKIY